MVDEIYDRGYQAARNQLNDSISRIIAAFGRSVLDAFTVLNRIEYGAPWQNEISRPRCD